MDGGAWWATVHGVAKSQMQLSDFTFTFPFHALEKEMATHSSVLTWRVPGMGEPGGLPSVGSHRVGHDWSDLAAAAAADLSFYLIIYDSCVKQLPLVVPQWWLANAVIIFYISWFSAVMRHLFMHACVHSFFISIESGTLIYSFIAILILLPKWSYIWPVWAPSSWLLISLW